MSTSGNGWVFQPGVWSDHPDYALWIDSERVTVPNISENTSHSTRLPYILLSLRNAHPQGSERFSYFNNLLEGIGEQMVRYVLVPPSEEFRGVRTTNYLDGRNHPFRVGYANRLDFGYVPYQQSSSFLTGWWSFTGNKIIRELYAEQAGLFPLAEEVIALYAGTPSPRHRHYFAIEPYSLWRGMWELIVRLAGIDYSKP